MLRMISRSLVRMPATMPAGATRSLRASYAPHPEAKLLALSTRDRCATALGAQTPKLHNEIHSPGCTDSRYTDYSSGANAMQSGSCVSFIPISSCTDPAATNPSVQVARHRLRAGVRRRHNFAVDGGRGPRSPSTVDGVNCSQVRRGHDRRRFGVNAGEASPADGGQPNPNPNPNPN